MAVKQQLSVFIKSGRQNLDSPDYDMDSENCYIIGNHTLD